jgi:hypothetical protein
MKNKMRLLHTEEYDDFYLQIYSYKGLGAPEVFTFHISFQKSKGRRFILLTSLRYKYVTDTVEHGIYFFKQIVSFFVSSEFKSIGKYGHFEYDDFHLKYINVAINFKYCECLRFDEVSNEVFSGAVSYLYKPEELPSRSSRARSEFTQKNGPNSDRRYKQDPVVQYWASISFELP